MNLCLERYYPAACGRNRTLPMAKPPRSRVIVPAMRQILWVQALRGLAALSIAAFHISQAAGWFAGGPAELPYAWMRHVPWEAGVDVFFVISGFVIVYASAHMFGDIANVKEFLGRRIARIVPLYWLVTSLVILAAMAHALRVASPLGDGIPYIVASYAFIPWMRPDGVMFPLYRPGWTLEYEMLFYGIVAVLLAVRLRFAVPLIAAIVAALPAAGALWRPAQPQLLYWTDPIVIEFAYGVLLAYAVLAGARIPRWAQLACVAAGVLGFAFYGTAHGVHRAFSYGIPAAFLVAASLGSQPKQHARLARTCVLLGDMSYALYLTHLLPTRTIGAVWTRLHLFGPIGIATYILVTLAAAAALALAVNYWFERPATRTARFVLRAA